MPVDSSIRRTPRLKGLCHGCMVHFVNCANYASFSAMELGVHKEITCKRQNHSFLLKNTVPTGDWHLTKNGRLELVPVLLYTL